MLKFAAMPPGDPTNTNNNQGNYNFLTGTYTSDTVNPLTGMPQTMQTGVSGASGIGSIVGGIADLIGSKKRIAGARRDKNRASNRIKNFYSDAASGTYDYTLDPGFSDMYDMSRTKTSTDPLMRQGATAVNALQQGGERSLLSGLNATTRALAEGETQLGLSDLQREMMGLNQLTQARQGITQANQQFDRELGMRRLGQDELAQATAQQNIQNLQQARRDAFGNIASGVVETGLSFINPFAKEGMKVPNYGQGGMNPGLAKLKEDHPSVYQKITGKEAEYGMKYPGGGMMPQYPGGGKMHEYGDGGETPAYQMGGGMPGGMNAGVLAQIMGGQRGGQPPVQGPLPGPASHDTNPIDMINKKGEKVAEAMGGEFIINNDQAEAMMAEHRPIKEKIEAGDQPSQEEWMEYYQAVDGVFSQPQFQDNMA